MIDAVSYMDTEATENKKRIIVIEDIDSILQIERRVTMIMELLYKVY